MSMSEINKWIVSGNLAGDVEEKTVKLKDGKETTILEATLYVRKPRTQDESFTVRLTIWERSGAWRKRDQLKKGALILCTGNVDVRPYLAKADNKPKAGLNMTVVDVDLLAMPKEGKVMEEKEAVLV